MRRIVHLGIYTFASGNIHWCGDEKYDHTKKRCCSRNVKDVTCGKCVTQKQKESLKWKKS